MREQIVVGNWKMNGTPAEARQLIGQLLAGSSRSERVTVVVCPPYTTLETASNLLQGKHISLGAQDLSEHRQGAYTGEISAEMLLTVGVSYVILGHSERRQYHLETDDKINRKVKVALSAKLTPIICVGETLQEREAGDTEMVVGRQVQGCLSGLSLDQLTRIVIAYEPVWAIGTGKTATPHQAQLVHAFIRAMVADIDAEAAAGLPILYGGSVKPNNAKELMSEADIDGALVGGASLKADDFIAIIQAC
jgi:triosephosphate isomerase